MIKHNKYRAYIRRANGRERAETLRIAYRLAFYRLMRKPFYVMVQRGWPNLAVEVGESRAEIAGSIVPVWAGWMTFKQWARQMQRKADPR